MIRVNPENFPEENVKLTKKLKGPILAGTIAASVAVFGSQLLFNSNDRLTDQPEDLLSSNTIEVASDDINDLNLIINDNDCGNAFFEDVCDSLEEQGIKFEISRQNDNLKHEDATIITLDQQMVSGEGVTLIGPQQDGTANHSEALLKAAQVTFHQRAWDTNSIAGIATYKTDENGEIVYTTVPSPTEQDVLDDSAYITFAFGTMKEGFTPEKVAEDLVLSLGRYHYFLENDSKYISELDTPESYHMSGDNSYYFSKEINGATAFNPELVVKVQSYENTSSHSK